MSKEKEDKPQSGKKTLETLSNEVTSKNKIQAHVESSLKKIESNEQEKNKTFIILEIIEYVPNSVVIKTIIKKTTGNVTVSSFDTGEALTEKTSPFDSFIQVIDGNAEIVINGESHLLDTGKSIIIPAHSSHIIKANNRFKIISTVIKSGYDDVSIY